MGQQAKEGESTMKPIYIRLLFSIFLLLFVLSGCMYPEEELAKNKTPNINQLELVQQAVDAYVEKTDGLVPIKTKEMDTPVFQKYLVDFPTLKDSNLLTETPGNAFENGGIYQYTIITPEEYPRVKIFDLRMTETIRSVNVKLHMYQSKNKYPPFYKKVEKDVYTLNYKKLGYSSDPVVKSPYSGENLPIIIDTDGKLHVDYRIDLQKALEEFDHDYKNGDDIRYIIPNNTPFVPAYSLPYTIKDGEVIFDLE